MDDRRAVYRREDVDGLRWDFVTGGLQTVCPYPTLFGYVSCDEMISGDLAHSGSHGSCPHVIKVCVLKCDNDPEIYARLAGMAGEKPPRPRFCREDALEIVAEAVEIRGPELRAELESRRHSRTAIGRVLPFLESTGYLVSRRGERRAKVYRLGEKAQPKKTPSRRKKGRSRPPSSSS